MARLSDHLISNIAVNAAREADRMTRKLKKARMAGRAVTLSQNDAELIKVALRRAARVHDDGTLQLGADQERRNAEGKRDRDFKMEKARNHENDTIAKHVCGDYAVAYESNGALGHGFECGMCGAFLQAG